MKILAFDIGKEMAFAFTENGKDFDTGRYTCTNLDKYTSIKKKYKNIKGGKIDTKNYLELSKWIKNTIDLWKPTHIVLPYPTFRIGVISSQNKIIGIIYLLASKKNAQIIEINDSVCKKAILKNGKASKENIINYFKQKDEHTADACLFAKYIHNDKKHKNQNKNKNKNNKRYPQRT